MLDIVTSNARINSAGNPKNQRRLARMESVLRRRTNVTINPMSAIEVVVKGRMSE